MKKILAFILAAITAVTFVSCGKKDTSSSENNVSENGTQTENSPIIPEDPNEYLSYVLLENNDFVSILSKKLADFKESNINSAANAEVNISLGNGAKTFFKDVSGSDGVYEAISWFSNASLSFDAIINDSNLMKLTTGLGINSTEIAKADITASLNDNKVYFALPEISDKILFTDIPENISDSIKNFDISFIPDSETAERLTEKFIYIIIDNLDNVKKSPSELTVDNITVDTEKIDIELNQENALDISEAIIETAVADSDIKNIITNFANTNYTSAGFESAEEMIDGIYDKMNSALESIQNTEHTSDDVLKIALYVNADHVITGLNISHDDGEIIRYSYAEDEGFFSCILAINEKTVVQGDGKISNDFIYGNLNVYSTDGKNICTVLIDDLNLAALENGYLNGSASVRFKKEFLNSIYLPDFMQSCVLVFDFRSTPDNSSSLTLTVNYKEQKVLAVKFSVAEKPLSQITIPSNAIDMRDKDSLNAFKSSVNLGTVFTNISNAGANNLLSIFKYLQ